MTLARASGLTVFPAVSYAEGVPVFIYQKIGKGEKMRKTMKKVLAVVTALTTLLGMSSLVSAADDIVLDGAGDSAAALMKTIDPGDTGSYKYIGWAYAGAKVSGDYKYLKLTYHGDPTALEEIRLELVEPDDNPDGPGVLQAIRWFGENEEGSLVTSDGKLAPAPTSKDQTVVIDLEKSGFDLSRGIRAFHIHSTPGKGTVTFTDARLMTSNDSAGSDNSSANGADKTSSGKSESSAEAVSKTDATEAQSKGVEVEKVKIGKVAVSKDGRKAKITLKKVKGAKGYQVKYSTGKKFKKTATKTKTFAKAKFTIKNLNAGKKYFITARAYKVEGGKKYYGKWSKVKVLKVKK